MTEIDLILAFLTCSVCFSRPSSICAIDGCVDAQGGSRGYQTWRVSCLRVLGGCERMRASGVGEARRGIAKAFERLRIYAR